MLEAYKQNLLATSQISFKNASNCYKSAIQPIDFMGLCLMVYAILFSIRLKWDCLSTNIENGSLYCCCCRQYWFRPFLFRFPKIFSRNKCICFPLFWKWWHHTEVWYVLLMVLMKLSESYTYPLNAKSGPSDREELYKSTRQSLRGNYKGNNWISEMKWSLVKLS